MKKNKLSKLKSGQYPDWMTQVTLGSEQQKKKIHRLVLENGQYLS